MKRVAVCVCIVTMLTACAGVRPRTPPPNWDRRVAQLQSTPHWRMQGRVAVAVGNQGWQANIDWLESGGESEVSLSGPFGMGTVRVQIRGTQLRIIGAEVPNAEDFLRQRLGFVPPFDDLRFWLLGVPNASQPFELTKNAQDRAATLKQLDWSVEYPAYRPVAIDVLPERLSLARADIRVKLAVHRWDILH